MTIRVDLFQMSFIFSLYFLRLWWEAIDQLVAWYMHIFCVRESVLMWLWSICIGYLSRVSLLLGSVKYWVFKHHLNNQCCLNDLLYPSQMLSHSQHGLFILVTCFQLKNAKMIPWQFYHEVISSAHMFQKVSLRQWLEALAKACSYKLLIEFPGESLLNNCLGRIASCHP